MALKIRLARGGAKKRPYYRIVVAEATAPRDGRFVEKVGTYNPMVDKTHPERLRLDAERTRYWLGVGAQPTDRVVRFLAQAGIIANPGVNETPKKSAPKKKAQERLKQEEEARLAAQAAAAEAAAQKKAESEPAAPEPASVVENVDSAETQAETPAEESAPSQDA